MDMVQIWVEGTTYKHLVFFSLMFLFGLIFDLG